MKKNSLNLLAALSMGLLMTATYGCSSDVEEVLVDNSEVTDKDLHVCEINLNVQVNGYDGQPSAKVATRAGSTEGWNDGDKIYLRFTSPLGITTGEAVYNSTKANWTLSYYGSLYEGAANTCTAVYVENAEKVEGSVVSLTEGSVIYEDNTGSYIVEGGDLTVTANLSPKVGRLRFTGTSGKTMKVYGISHYTTYDASTHLFTNTNAAFENVVNSDGYTDYAYGYFSDEENPSVKLWIDKKEAYTRFFSSNVLAAGESGVMTIPTEASHSSWTWGLTFNIQGKIMTMIPVEGGTFAMGNESETNSSPVHNVTLNSYCIGETEVTGEFYYKVTGSTSTGNTKPLHTYQPYWLTFAKTLTTQTGAKFVLPTEAQWEYAARGGKKSKGYVYSGSNKIDEVAWYKSNSNNERHPVKQKLPNELGLYDMSGNSIEIVRDYWYAYSESSEINPVGATSGNYYVARGGRYSSDAQSTTTTYRAQWSTYQSDSYYIGGRMVIEW